jgi:hypothetical protein
VFGRPLPPDRPPTGANTNGQTAKAAPQRHSRHRQNRGLTNSGILPTFPDDGQCFEPPTLLRSRLAKRCPSVEGRSIRRVRVALPLFYRRPIASKVAKAMRVASVTNSGVGWRRLWLGTASRRPLCGTGQAEHRHKGRTLSGATQASVDAEAVTPCSGLLRCRCHLLPSGLVFIDGGGRSTSGDL